MKLFYYISLFFSLSNKERDSLVSNNIGFFHHCFNKKFSGVPTVLKEEIRQESLYGFIRASKKFNPKRNVSFLSYSQYYIHGYGLNSLRKYNRTNINTVNFDGELLSHTKDIYANNVLDTKHENLDAINKFNKYCNTSKYGNVLKAFYYENLSQRKIGKKYNISRSSVTIILKREMDFFRKIYGY
tara:strand:- start:1197 stop:1751 length:555 start_codon:yes stop_codon:yes gene_type:complete